MEKQTQEVRFEPHQEEEDCPLFPLHTIGDASTGSLKNDIIYPTLDGWDKH